jgi:hypothetical protein
MSDWQLHVPHRSRSDHLGVVVPALASELEGEDRDVARWLAVNAFWDLKFQTAGELLDHLEAITPAERRELLDQARADAGLEPTADVDERRRAEAATVANRMRGNPSLQRCPHCDAYPLTEVGSLAETRVRRWHCPQHVHLAQPGDMDDRPSPWKVTDCGTIVEVDAAEVERQAAAAESRRLELEAQAAQRSVEAEERRRHNEAVAADVERLTPPMVPSS